MHDPEAWWCKEASFAATVSQLEAGLQVLEEYIPDDEAMIVAEADVSEQLQAMLEALPKNAERWRASWR